MADRIQATMRPVLPAIAVSMSRVPPSPAAFTPSIPGPPISEDLTELTALITEIVEVQRYDFDALVSSSLSI